MSQIYKVESTDVDRNYLIGYFTGEIADINSYCATNHNVGYGLEIKPITIKHIPAGTADKLRQLKEEQRQLRLKSQAIEKQIKEII